jgi:hypothetical protein
MVWDLPRPMPWPIDYANSIIQESLTSTSTTGEHILVTVSASRLIVGCVLHIAAGGDAQIYIKNGSGNVVMRLAALVDAAATRKYFHLPRPVLVSATTPNYTIVMNLTAAVSTAGGVIQYNAETHGID